MFWQTKPLFVRLFGIACTKWKVKVHVISGSRSGLPKWKVYALKTWTNKHLRKKKHQVLLDAKFINSNIHTCAANKLYLFWMLSFFWDSLYLPVINLLFCDDVSISFIRTRFVHTYNMTIKNFDCLTTQTSNQMRKCKKNTEIEITFANNCFECANWAPVNGITQAATMTSPSKWSNNLRNLTPIDFSCLFWIRWLIWRSVKMKFVLSWTIILWENEIQNDTFKKWKV